MKIRTAESILNETYETTTLIYQAKSQRVAKIPNKVNYNLGKVETSSYLRSKRIVFTVNQEYQ